MRDMVRVPAGTPSQQYQAPSMRLGRSQFDLSKNHKTTFNAGYLIPYFLTEVLPGDTHTLKLQAFLRIFSPLDAPIMDNIHVGIDYFFVPNRLVWENWEKFLGASDEAGAQDTDYTLPRLADGNTVSGVESYAGSASAHLTARYMGLPIGLETVENHVQSLPFRAYNLVFNEWYRDQNLIDKVTVPKGNGPDSYSGYVLRKSAKRPDYFTTALPYLQKGDPVTIPLNGFATVVADGTGEPTFTGTSGGGPGSLLVDGSGTEPNLNIGGTGWTLNEGLEWDNPRLAADMSTLTSAFSINALREAAALQRLLERDARGGTRHPELIRSHFGVDVPDYRTQRPEYLGGGSGYINVSPVANTTDAGTADQGYLTGIGHGTLGGSFAKSFVEHGHIIGLLRARGEVSYQQGLDRMWSRATKYDIMWPELAMLGEQPIYNRELYSNLQDPADLVGIFGYQERYAEYRYAKSLITGKFQSDATGSLDFWHLAEDFSAIPPLNQSFIEDATPMARIVAVDSEPHFIIDGRFTHRVARALPVRPVPTLAPARF